MITPPQIKARREDLGLTQTQLAKMTGMSQGRVWDLENGKRGIGLVTARKLAKALKLDSQDFF